MEENQTEEKKVYLHYNHTDSCNHARWTARECYLFMYERPWQQINDFYSSLLNRRLYLSDLLGNDVCPQRSFSVEISHDVSEANFVDPCEEPELVSVPTKNKKGRWARATFKIVLSYQGSSFDGWQKQPGLNTVQGLVEKCIGRFVDEKKAEELKRKSLPLEACVTVAGRTDKGVTALKQVCSFYTWQTDVKAQDVEDAISEAAPGNLRVVTVAEGGYLVISIPTFLPNGEGIFTFFPLNDGEDKQGSDREQDDETLTVNEQKQKQINESSRYIEENIDVYEAVANRDDLENGKKPKNFSIERVNQLLHQLEGKSLSYKMFARDTKASRSMGPPTECFIYHVRATEARLPCANKIHGDVEEQKVMCIEPVANRFLRKMVRVLVATSIREAAAGADVDGLLKLMDATCRRATAPPAPPDGLCLVDVGYKEFNRKNCLIP